MSTHKQLSFILHVRLYAENHTLIVRKLLKTSQLKRKMLSWCPLVGDAL